MARRHPFPSRELTWGKEDAAGKLDTWRVRYAEVVRLNTEAIGILEPLADGGAEFRWLRDSYTLGRDFARLFLEYCGIHQAALDALGSGGEELLPRLDQAATAACAQADKVAAVYTPLDTYGGAWALCRETSDYLLRNYAAIRESLGKNRLVPVDEQLQWW